MRIATLSNASVVHTQRWVAHFRARGHEVQVWSVEEGPPELAAQRLPRAPLPHALRYPLAAPALRHALRHFAPDLVDAHFVPNYGLLGVLSGRRPLSVTAWGSDLLVSGVSSLFQAARVRFVLERADLVLADGGNLGRAARAAGAAEERLRVIPWGVDRGRFRDRRDRTPQLLLGTRMHEAIYDVPTLIEAARPVLERHPDAFLALAGAGSRTPALERLAGERLPAGRFRFLGRLSPDDLAGWLSRADVYLSASRSDSTSVSLLEAMASGALPVVSDIEGNREWVEEGEGARLFAVGDAEACAAAIERALGDAAWAASARLHNQRVIAERGDWDANLARVERLFSALARGERIDTQAAAAPVRP